MNEILQKTMKTSSGDHGTPPFFPENRPDRRRPGPLRKTRVEARSGQSDEDKIGGDRRTASMIGPAGLATAGSTSILVVAGDLAGRQRA
jgi:hypothetical protein